MKYVSLTISVGLTLIVFSFSTTSGTESASLSLEIANLIRSVLGSIFPGWDIDIDTLHTIVRKGAHMFEYFLLGVSWAVSFILLRIDPRYLLILAVMIPLTDEGIQIFSTDRGPSLIDAFGFDFPGFFIGGSLILILLRKNIRLKAPK